MQHLEPLHILHVEDSETDYEIISHVLKSRKLAFTCRRVEMEEDFHQALREGSYNIILSDYRLPFYDGMRALKYVREHYSHIPFILVTGFLTEDQAVDFIMKGATDYILKDHLQRLVPSLTRAIREAETERKRVEAEYASLRAQNHAEEILRSITDSYYFLDWNWRFLDVNPMAEQTIFKKTKRQLVGQNIWDLYPKSVGSPFHRNYFKVCETRKPSHFEAQSVITGRWLEVHVYPKQHGLEIYLRDIHERKMAMLQLEQVVANIPDSFFMVDDQWRYVFLNDKAVQRSGKSRDELLHRNIWEVHPEMVGADFRSHWERAMKERVPVNMDFYSPSDKIWFNHRVVPLAETGGIAAFITEVTQRKQDETALHISEHRLDTVLSSIDDHLVTYDRQWRYTYINESGAKMLGKRKEELLGKCIWDVYPQAVGNQYYRELHEALAQQRIIRSEHYYEPWRRWFENFIYPSPDGVTVFSSDITERKQIEEELNRSRRHLELTLDTAKVVAWTWDPSTNKVWTTDNINNIYGVSAVEYAEQGFSLIHPDDRPRHKALIAHILREGESYRTEFRIMRPDTGEIVWIEERATLLRQSNGEPKQLIGIAIDVTSRKSAEYEIHRLNQELELRVKQRTAELELMNRELDSFAYSVSHDLRAPIRAINGYAGLLRQEASQKFSTEESHFVDQIAKSASDMGKLVDGLLEFSRLSRKETDRIPINMEALFKEVIAEHQRTAPEYTLQSTVHELPSAMGDYLLIRQVIANLVSNSFKFTRKVHQPSLEVGCSTTDEGHVVYFVKDNGTGFDMQFANKLFGVFQRLHKVEDYEGTGIGLAFSKRIVERHGGKIWAEAEPGKGATFYFTLPTQLTSREV